MPSSETFSRGDGHDCPSSTEPALTGGIATLLTLAPGHGAAGNVPPQLVKLTLQVAGPGLVSSLSSAALPGQTE